MISLTNLRGTTQEFIGRRCTGYLAGGSAGTHVELELEPRVPLSPPSFNERITAIQRTTRAAYSIFIECSWRLDSSERVVCGAWDDNSEGGAMLRGLDQLVGLRLGDFQVTSPGLDAELTFEGYRLRIFCDQVNEIDAEDNYVLFTPAKAVIVGTRSVVREEPRTSGGGVV